LIVYKTIPTFRLLIFLLAIAVDPLVLFPQQLPAKEPDSSINKKQLPAYLNSKDILITKNFLSRQNILPDSIKANATQMLTGKMQERLKAYRNLFNDINNDLKKTIESPFSLSKGSISIQGTSSNINNDSLAQNNYHLFDGNAGGMILGIPFYSFYQNHYYPFIPEGNMNRTGFQYDREAYINSIKKKLSGKFNPEDLLDDIGDPVQLLKNAAEKSLRDELNNLKTRYKGLIDDKVGQIGDLKELFFKDPNAIRNILLDPKLMEQLKGKSELLAQLQNQINTGQKIDMQEFEGIKNDLLKYQGTEALAKIIESHNKKWQESGLLKRIKESGLIRADMIKKVINDPSVIRKMAKQKLDLNSLQRLFLSITKLNVGQTTADFSRLLTGNSLLQGISTGFLMNSKKSVNILAGNLKTFNSILDIPFSNSVFNNNTRMAGFQMQNGMQGKNSNAISLMAFQSLAGGQFPLNAFSLPRKSMVIGLSRQIEINQTNNVQIELSKSSGYYTNEFSGDSSNRRHASNDLFTTNNIFKSLAATINYTGEFSAINLETETYIRYAGINYDNPATAFAPAGAKEFGTALRKTFFEKKLNIYVRTNWRQYKFSEYTSNRWRNSNHFVDLKWKLNKGQSISLRYQPVRSVRVTNGAKYVNASTERLAATANIAARLRSIQYRNYFTLAYQKNLYLYQNTGFASNKTIQVASMQSFVIGKHVFYNNTSFNKVDNASAFIFFNTAFNNDLGFTYAIGKNLIASSSLNYNSIKGWYQQVSVKQSLAGELGKKIKMDMYIDIGKNIKTFQPLPYSLFRAEWSVQYLFNR